jgi:hypothetical protein
VSLFRRMKLAQLPNALSMTKDQRKTAMKETKMDKFDVLGFLNGCNIFLIEGELEEIESCDYGEILAGLELHQQQVREQGHIDEDVKFLQRESKFDAFENPASQLVGGYEADLSKIRRMPEKALRQWLIKYIEQLARARRKIEKSNVYTCQHQGIGW